MFSFLLKKKDRDATPVEDIIQGPSTDTPSNGGDDFIFVEKKGGGNGDPQRPQMPQMYPPMPPAPFGVTPMYPGIPSGSPSVATRTAPPVPYLQGVPFALAPELCTKSTFEATQTQVDGILALLTRQMSLDAEEEYSFALERSIQNECY